MREGVLALLLFAPLVVFAVTPDFDRAQIENRIKPIGQNRTETVESAPAKVEAKVATSAEPRSGKSIYEQYCHVCHESGLAGAPKFQVTADWKSRLQTKKLEGLMASAIKGLNAMPPKGTCMDCTDNDLKAAIEYMVPKS